MFKSKTLLTLALLTSVVSLTACGHKSPQSTPASSQSKVAQASSSSSSLAKAKTTTSTETSVSQQETSSEQPLPETSTVVTSSVDLDAIANGDFSSIAGTWANAKGTILMITEDGKVYYGGEQNENQYHQLEQFDFSHSRYLVGDISYYNNGERQGGAAVSIVPASVENSLGIVGEFDHLEIGHGIHSSQVDEQYFRQ